ncbi:hypothetical protein B0H17DRAFT_1136256 [Mycena rosella]|uniref:Uncharacterized protein n=1 Tax=Mycena rosella TaxID=1033263 RepID=A0AAD7GEQ7_MYCRO|nr:hypothetical protein B0H17DRAFT_1136256 [Mycena rosella]
MHAHFLFIAALFASPLIAAGSRRAHILVRQTDDDCSNECAAWNNESSDCNNTIINDAATCYNCFIKTGTSTQEDAQQTLNEFVRECDAVGTPVTNVTLTGNSAPSAGSGSTTPLPKSTSTPTHTSEAGEETSTTEAADETTTTDAPGDSASASASANSTDSASASATGSSGARVLKSGCTTGISAALAIISVFVALR